MTRSVDEPEHNAPLTQPEVSILDAVRDAAQAWRDGYRMNEKINIHVPSRDRVDPDEVAEAERYGFTVAYEEDRPQVDTPVREVDDAG